jgi:hypothetical protein
MDLRDSEEREAEMNSVILGVTWLTCLFGEGGAVKYGAFCIFCSRLLVLCIC